MSLYKTKQELSDLFNTLREDEDFQNDFVLADDTQDARTAIKKHAEGYGVELPKVSDRERLANMFRRQWGYTHDRYPGEQKFSWWGEQFDAGQGCSQGSVPAFPNPCPVQTDLILKAIADLKHEMNRACGTSTSLQSTTKEATMSNVATITVETRTFINGVDATNYTDGTLYSLISREEDAIAKLNALANKPERLVAEIAKRQAGIDSLVKFLNEKDAEKAA